LLDRYTLDPPPYVVELDQHPFGAALQARLAEVTGRGTVPNVLINGVSIGGGDEVAHMDSKGTLAEKIKDLGAKGMLDVRRRPSEDTDESHGLR
jgi:glutaredoxin